MNTPARTVVVPNNAVASALLKVPSAIVAVIVVLIVLLLLNLPDISINLGVMTVSLPTLAVTVGLPAVLGLARVLGVNMATVYSMVKEAGYTLPDIPEDDPTDVIPTVYPTAAHYPESVPGVTQTRLDGGLVAQVPTKSTKARIALL